jgi:perosamine synthetase
MADLRERGVDVAEYLPCIHLLTYMRDHFGFGVGLCPTAEELSGRTIALPFFPGIEAEDQEYVVDVLREAVGR